MKIIEQAKVEYRALYSRDFSDKTNNYGFKFDCDKDGNLTTEFDSAKRNYQDCINGKHPDLIDKGIVEHIDKIKTPMIGECTCGKHIYLYSFTNECDKCGRLYNNFGQELAPANEWEEQDRYACYGPQNGNEDY